jgi:hypothetical protein
MSGKLTKNTKGTNRFLASLLISILALCVSVIAIIVSAMQNKNALTEQQRQFAIIYSEDLSLSLNPCVTSIYPAYKITYIKLGEIGQVVQLYCELTISNTGNQALSILDYSLSIGDHPDAMYYSGIDGGLWLSKHQLIELPLHLQPGESKIALLLIGIPLSQNVVSVLTRLQASGTLSFSNVNIELAKLGIDLFGNKIELKEYGKGAYTISNDNKNQIAPTVWLRMSTARGNVFSTSANYYQKRY